MSGGTFTVQFGRINFPDYGRRARDFADGTTPCAARIERDDAYVYLHWTSINHTIHYRRRRRIVIVACYGAIVHCRAGISAAATAANDGFHDIGLASGNAVRNAYECVRKHAILFVDRWHIPGRSPCRRDAVFILNVPLCYARAHAKYVKRSIRAQYVPVFGCPCAPA